MGFFVNIKTDAPKMYHRVRRRTIYLVVSAIIILSISSLAFSNTARRNDKDTEYENNFIEVNEDPVKFDKRYGLAPNDDLNKESLKYDTEKERKSRNNVDFDETQNTEATKDFEVLPLEKVTINEKYLPNQNEVTTQNFIAESMGLDLTVIPLPTKAATNKNESSEAIITTELNDNTSEMTETYTIITEMHSTTTENLTKALELDGTSTDKLETTTNFIEHIQNNDTDVKSNNIRVTRTDDLKINTSDSTSKLESDSKFLEISEVDSEEQTVPVYTELDVEIVSEIPDDYYDSKDVIPTRPPNTDALSVIFGFAGSVVESVVESVAERVVPKGLIDLFKRMQRQNEALEAERLRSREENGGLGQFGRGILKSISSGLSKPLSQLMAGVRDIGSLDNDRSFVGSLASGVTSVANYANTLADAFKDRVQAIYPGTVWCGDGHSATARSGDLGLFFFTDTCCRQHDACKIYIRSGETKYGLTNTGLFTRSHCSCDTMFRDCLRKTNSLVSAQIGLTYFNVLGPQCFRNAHPIVKCLKKTRITGLKCEEYELDYTKPKMWQWFDNETF